MNTQDHDRNREQERMKIRLQQALPRVPPDAEPEIGRAHV